MTDRQRFEWRWLLAGAAMMVGGNVAAWRLLGQWLRQQALQDHMLRVACVASAISLGVYFASGLVVGRLSSGNTGREPAWAALLSLVLLFGIQLANGMLNVVGLLLGSPLLFAAAYGGGLAGGRWQQAARRRHGPSLRS